MSPVALLSRISARERTMLGALVAVGFLIWFSNLWKNWDALGVRHRKVENELAQQAVWLADADRLERELGESLAKLDPAKTYDATELVALIDELSRTSGLKHELGTPVTEEQELFVRHTLKVAVKNAPLAKLIEMERGLAENHPYATLEEFSITANKSDPRLLNARLTVSAYQLVSELDEMDDWSE